jgi:hypothetical protein
MKLSRKVFQPPVGIAEKSAMAGKNQQALDWLERDFELRSAGITRIGVNPAFIGLRKEPRFQELLRRMNFPEDVIARNVKEKE